MPSVVEPLNPRLPQALEHRTAYPPEADAPDDPRHVQTHLSHVFLTRSRVYKLRKSVHFDFVDFGSRAARDRDCVNEIELNRRLAPDVYLGLAPVWPEGDAARVGALCQAPVVAPPGRPAPEHCVVMQRLPDGRDALSLLEEGALERAHLEQLAQQIARFHAAHRLPDPPSVEDWRALIQDPVLENLRVLEEGTLDARDRSRVERIEERARSFMKQWGERLDARLRRGLAVDGHGDLHLQHVWLPRAEGPAVVIDCLEFREAFRQLDPASEVAFLAMDLEYRGRPDLAEAFLASYAACADDHELFGVVDYFISYRAAVRAKVAELAGRDPDLPEKQREGSRASVSRHLALAERALDPRPPGKLVGLTGRIGTGKTTVAHAAAKLLGAPVLSSDRVRKQLAGMEPMERTREDFGQGIFGEAMSDATYEGLLTRALPLIRSGRPVVLDATYASRKYRDALRAWADAEGVSVLLIETACDPDRVRSRLAERRAHGQDASDAGPEHYDASARQYSPPDEWPPENRIVLHTDRNDWPADLRRALETLDDIPTQGGTP